MTEQEHQDQHEVAEDAIDTLLTEHFDSDDCAMQSLTNVLCSYIVECDDPLMAYACLHHVGNAYAQRLVGGDILGPVAGHA